MKLRDYQNRASASARELILRSVSCLIVMPTGTGKSVVLTDLVQWVVGRGKRVLVLAHRAELVEQLVKHCERMGLSVGVEMAEMRSDNGWFGTPDVVVASKDSLKNRLRKFDPREFGLIVTDEAHHAPARSYRKIYDYFQGVPHVGVTATPDRADKIGLGTVFDEVAFEYGIRDAINDGWLVPLVQRKVVVEDLDFSKVRAGSDFTDNQIANLIKEESVLHAMIAPMVQEAAGRRTLMFLPRVDVAQAAAEITNRPRYSDNGARVVWGAMDPLERARTLAQFADGEFRYLANVALLTEGWDDPATDGEGVQCLAMMRMTKSRALYAQCVGRILRPLKGVVDGLETAEERKAAIAASAKPVAYVIDFVGNSGRHELVHAVDVLAGNEPKEVRDRVREMTDSDDTVEEQIQRAEEEIEQEKAELERVKAERARSHRHVAADATYRTVEVDAFKRVKFSDTVEINNPSIPDRTLNTLRKFKVPSSHINAMTPDQAGRMAQECIHASKSGAGTYKMRRTLERYGFDPLMPFDSAKREISRIAKNGWRK